MYVGDFFLANSREKTRKLAAMYFWLILLSYRDLKSFPYPNLNLITERMEEKKPFFLDLRAA
jgi:hypothetical protein